MSTPELSETSKQVVTNTVPILKEHGLAIARRLAGVFIDVETEMANAA